MKHLTLSFFFLFATSSLYGQQVNPGNKVLDNVDFQGVFKLVNGNYQFNNEYSFFELNEIETVVERGQSVSQILSSYNIYPDLNAFIIFKELNQNIQDVNDLIEGYDIKIPFSPQLYVVSEDLAYLNASSIVVEKIEDRLDEFKVNLNQVDDQETRTRIDNMLEGFEILTTSSFTANKTGYLDIIEKEITHWNTISPEEYENSISKTYNVYLSSLKSNIGFKTVKVTVIKDGVSFPNLRIIAKLKDYFYNPVCNSEICQIKLPGLTKSDTPIEGSVAQGIYSFYGVDASNSIVTEIFDHDTRFYDGQVLELLYKEE